MSIHTDSWVLPDTKNTINVDKGDGVKLKNNLGEKFWVNFQYEKDGLYYGKVDNNLIRDSSYNYGDIVSFNNDHIWQVNKPVNRSMHTLMVIKHINMLKKILGRMPTLEEIDNLYTYMGA